MKVTFFENYQLHKCCANDDLRPALNFVHFMNGYAYATNAHVIVRAAITEIVSECTPEIVKLLNNHSISARNFARVIRHREVEITDNGFVYTNELERVETLYRWYNIKDNTITGFYKHANDELLNQPRIPNMESILPDSKDVTIPIDYVGINVNSLMDVSNAMGGNEKKLNKMDLYFTGKGHAILCKKTWTDGTNEDVVGLIMPCLIDEPVYAAKQNNNN